jgi:CBS domain-containing protein
MKTLREIMRPGFIFGVQRDASVADAARTMTTNNVGIVVVLAGDRLVGVFSERDIVRRVVDRGLDPTATSVAEVMTTDLVVAQADDDYRSAMRMMDQTNIRHLRQSPKCARRGLRCERAEAKDFTLRTL